MMKLILSLLLLGSTTYAALSDVDRAEFVAHNMMAKFNPGFESGKAKWVASGGTFLTTNSGPAAGLLAATWDASAISQTLSNTFAIPAGFFGHNCILSMKYKNGDANLAVQVLNVSNLVIGSQTLSTQTNYANVQIPFVCPSSGTLKVQVVSSADAALVTIDDFFVGDDYAIGQVVTAPSFYGSAKTQGAASCEWSVTQTTYAADFAADTDCNVATVTGSVTAPATKVPQFLMNSAPPGDYFVTADFFHFSNASTGDTDACELIDENATVLSEQGYNHYATNSSTVDGKYLLHLKGRVSYTSTASHTIKIRCKSASSASKINADSSGRTLEFNVIRFPGTTGQSFRFDQMANSWSGYHASNCSFSRTNAAYGDPAADASCTFTERSNRNFGTVSSYTSAGNNLPGIVFTPSRAGKYWVCALPIISGSIGGDASELRLSDGTTEIVEKSFVAPATGTYDLSIPLCGLYDSSSTSPVTLRIQTKSSADTVVINSIGNAKAVEWSIFQIDQQFPAPVIKGLPESASVSVSGVVSNESVDWINGNCALSSSVFTCTLNSTFLSTPNCVVSISGTTPGNITLESISTATIKVDTFDSSGSASDRAFKIMCMEPKN